MQAVLIIAHKDISQIKNLVDILKKKFDIYIHFDKKMNVLEKDKEELQKEGIHIYQEISVNWGSWGIAAATRLLLTEALKNRENTYFHIISGQCYPTKKIDDIYDFYENNDDIYMLSSLVGKTKKSGEPLLYWQKYYYNYDKINRRSIFGKIYHRCTIFTQTLFRVDKIKKLNINVPLYQGPNWMDLPRYAVEYLLDYFDKHQNIQKLFMTGFCPDEFWIQTILCNSQYNEKIKQEYHRYIKWEPRYGSYPAVLDESDYETIRNGNYHFCRKIDIKYSSRLIALLIENCGF